MGSSALQRPAYRRFCELLRKWRQQAGLTQRELGKKMRKPASFVHKSEVGERRVDALEFIAWCRACDLDPFTALSEADREM
jgi:transcriptional regulator with XRE-family HTH domain